jgi:hypothetical protein
MNQTERKVVENNNSGHSGSTSKPQGQGGEQNPILDNLKNAISVDITWIVVGPDEGVMAGQVTPVGGDIVLRCNFLHKVF